VAIFKGIIIKQTLKVKGFTVLQKLENLIYYKIFNGYLLYVLWLCSMETVTFSNLVEGLVSLLYNALLLSLVTFFFLPIIFLPPNSGLA
jgi:hypothetical protein